MATFGGEQRGLTARRSRADDEHPSKHRGGAAGFCRASFLAQGGIDHALGAFTVEHPPRDALVDRQASADPFRLAAPGLGHRVGVGESGAAQRDKVELAVADRLLHVLDQPGQPADADYRHVHPLLDRLGVPHQRTRRNHRQQRHRRVVVAGADVEGVDEGFEHLAERESVVKTQTALVGLFDAESIQHRKVRSHLRPDALDHLQGEPGTVLQRAAPVVGAAIGERGQELPQQVAVRAVQFHGVEAGGDRPAGTLHVAIDQPRDFILVDRPGRGTERAGDPRRGRERRLVAFSVALRVLTTGVMKLEVRSSRLRCEQPRRGRPARHGSGRGRCESGDRPSARPPSRSRCSRVMIRPTPPRARARWYSISRSSTSPKVLANWVKIGACTKRLRSVI